MWTRRAAALAPVRSRGCRVGGILAGVALLAATAGAHAAAPVGGPVPETPDQALPSSPVPRLEPADVGPARQPVPTWQLALLDVAPVLGTALRPSAPDAVEPVALRSRGVSGLPWLSGVACPPPGMDRWRGRRFDTAWFGMPKSSWGAMLSAAGSGGLRARAATAPQLVVSLPLLPQSSSMQHAACARGAFDGYFCDIGAALRANGAGGAVIRLGKEANRGRPPYGYRLNSQLPAYRDCFRHASRALKQGAPQLTIEWTNARQTLSSVNVLDAYPGGDVVDIIGVHYYNNPKLGRIETQADWDAEYTRKYPSGGPQGLGAWLAAAGARGKKLAVSEWGLWGTSSVADTPVYIENMFRFFRTHASRLAYESYFQCAALHRMYPSTEFPRASGTYRQLW